jgi:hypothetical protein
MMERMSPQREQKKQQEWIFLLRLQVDEDYSAAFDFEGAN